MVVIQSEWYCREIGDVRRKPTDKLPSVVPCSLPPPSNQKSSIGILASSGLTLFAFLLQMLSQEQSPQFRTPNTINRVAGRRTTHVSSVFSPGNLWGVRTTENPSQLRHCWTPLYSGQGFGRSSLPSTAKTYSFTIL